MEPKRQIEIDTQIGRLMGKLADITTDMRRALQREWELEQLAEEYYTLLKTIALDYELPAHQGKVKRELELRAEKMGISDMKKGDV